QVELAARAVRARALRTRAPREVPALLRRVAARPWEAPPAARSPERSRQRALRPASARSEIGGREVLGDALGAATHVDQLGAINHVALGVHDLARDVAPRHRRALRHAQGRALVADRHFVADLLAIELVATHYACRLLRYQCLGVAIGRKAGLGHHRLEILDFRGDLLVFHDLEHAQHALALRIVSDAQFARALALVERVIDDDQRAGARRHLFAERDRLLGEAAA